MRVVRPLAILAFLALPIASAVPAYAKTYPPAGTVKGLTMQPASVTAGDDIAFTVTGTGTCRVTIEGYPGAVNAPLKGYGALPLTIHGSIPKAGTFTIDVAVYGEYDDPSWCNGTASAKIVVKDKLIGQPPLPEQVTGAASKSISTLPTAPPAILSIAVMHAPPGGAPRPEPGIIYAGEKFKVDVKGNVNNQNTPNADPRQCAYTVNVLNANKALQQGTDEFVFTTFGEHDVGVAPPEGEYHLVVKPYSHYAQAACLGAAETNVFFHKKMAVVTDMKLVGFGFHFNMADAMGLDQFCENCTSIFSPAHNRAFLGVLPTVAGNSPGGKCAYEVAINGNGNSRSGEGFAVNGGASPPYPELYTSGAAPPFWNMFNDDVNTYTVAITPGTNLGVAPCYIANGKISKTITFYKDPTKPKVVK